MTKVLYLSCHSILERDEISLLYELGYEVFSPGAYIRPEENNDMRPAIPGLTYKKEFLEAYHKLSAQFPGQDIKDHLTKEFVDLFDIIIVMHSPQWIANNWEAMKHKRVIWRTIGQSISHTEASLSRFRKEGLEIVRYSPMERNIPGYLGEDALIRFYKDPDEFTGWTGEKPEVITFAQHMQQRNTACNYEFFEATTRPFPRALYGPGSEQLAYGRGKVSFDELKQAMQQHRVYFYTGTHPASYTLNFMESFMTGIPIVAIGSQKGNASYFSNHNLYEIPNLIENGYNGYVSDEMSQLRRWIILLLNDHDVAKTISMNARASAIKLFGKEKIKKQWAQYLG